MSNIPVISRAGNNTILIDYIFKDLKTSFNGKMIAGMAYRDYSTDFATTYGFIEVFNFDASTGRLTARIKTPRTYGYFFQYFSLEFSTDNRLLYACKVQRIGDLQPCGFGTGSVTQYNLCYTDSLEFDRFSMTVASTFQACHYWVTWGTIQTGADKRIHMPFTGLTVSTINFPNRIGNSCNYVFDSYQVPNGNFGYVATPDFHHKLMEKAVKNNIVYDGGCHPNPITFHVTNDTITRIQWNFGDAASSSNNSSMLSPSHVFSSPGIYTVGADLYNSRNELIETITEKIEIKDPDKRILFDYPEDTTICAGGYIDIKLKVVNGLYHWYQLYNNGTLINSQIGDSIRIDYSGTWYVEMRQNDCNGCRKLDSITVTVLPKPSFSLGPDQNLCSGDSVLLTAYDPDASYTWNTGATTSSIWAKQGGLYWTEAEFNNNGCPLRDSIVITQVPPMTFSLGADTVLCNNQTLLLNPGVANASYLWQDGTAQPQFIVTAPGDYWVRISSASGCTKSDTINVNYINAQQVYLGNDTTLCEGRFLSLSANVNNAGYLWSTGATTPGIMVTQTGSYWVRVDNGACIVTDTIIINFDAAPTLTLGNDIVLCPQQELLLDPGITSAQYIWQDGSQHDSYKVVQPGMYWVNVERGACVVSDTIYVGYHTVPIMNLGPDRRFCTGDSLLVEANPGFGTYTWINGSNTAATVLHQAGTYWVKGTSSDGCEVTDTLQVLSLYPLPVVDLGPDTDICAGSSKTFDAGSGFANYAWSNGSSSPTLTVTNTGTYAVTVTDQYGCRGDDAIEIRSLLDLPKNFLPTDTTICSYGELVLSSLQLYSNYHWSTGSSSRSATINAPGAYWLEVEDNYQCRGRDTVVVTLKECMQGFFVPSAFTPNSDGKNDTFAPLLFGDVEQYNFIVYNRWGQIVFQSATRGKGWDGSFINRHQDSNVFIWVCHYKLQNEPARTQKGTVLLIR